MKYCCELTKIAKVAPKLLNACILIAEVICGKKLKEFRLATSDKYPRK